jgi:RNA polymerase sigma-70 factor (ECF subfamily)
MRAVHAIDYLGLPEPELVAFARAGDHEAFRAIMTRCNQRLFRIARAVVRDEGEAEDVLQEAYARAFAAIASFRGESGVATWLTRIVLNEAHGRRRRRRPTVELDEVEAAQESAQVLELSAEETARHLNLKVETVKTRLHRARRRLREALDAQLADVMVGAYPFLGARCARITEAVLQRLAPGSGAARIEPA